jgi:hypothetical protein
MARVVRYNELRDMLTRTKGTISALKSSSKQSQPPTDRQNAATSVFADILRQVHSSPALD